jgi:tetratricopeptide (TPR) repeat protein
MIRAFRVYLAYIAVGLIAGLSFSQSASNNAPAAAGSASPVLSDGSALGEARVLYGKGAFDAAIEKYQTFLKERPDSPDAFAGLVRTYLKLHDVDKASGIAEQALAQKDSPRLRVARAEVWFRQGKLAEAEKEFVDIINSGYPDAHAYLGLARERRAIAMYKSAKRMIEMAHQLDPADPDIQEQWIDTLSSSERIRYLEKSLAGDNNWDADRRANVASYLEYLKERAKQRNLSPCRLVSKTTSTETPMVRLLTDPQHLRGYGLRVSINGHESNLLLDTGASGILVNRLIAEKAGVSKIVETKVGGIGNQGRRNAFVGIAGSIKIGELEFQNCPIEIMDSRSVVGEDGLIGTDIFENFLVNLDFPKEKLRLSELPKRPGEAESELALNNMNDQQDDSDSGEQSTENKPTEAKPTGLSGPQDRYVAPEMRSYTTVYRFGHDLLVPTHIGNVPSKLFLVDTGALMNSISPSAAREITKVHEDNDMIVKGISGRVDKVYSASKAVLQFGHIRQENQEMTAFDTKPLSDSAGIEISGFLGFVTLRMLDIKIDYRDALINFEIDPRFSR